MTVRAMAGVKSQLPNARFPPKFKGQLPGLIATLSIEDGSFRRAETGPWSSHLPGMNNASADAVKGLITEGETPSSCLKLVMKRRRGQDGADRSDLPLAQGNRKSAI